MPVRADRELKVNKMENRIFKYGDPKAEIQLIQLVDEHDLQVIEQEVLYISELTGGQPFGLTAVKVHSWNEDLSPWKAPAVFGNEDFGDGAARTLEELLTEVIPAQSSAKKLYIGGYSLAGLFALWAGFQTNVFSGVAAASPSMWFPGFTEYMREHELQVDAVYLSLGDKEEKTKNQVMKQVGTAIREAHEILQEKGIRCTLEWNSGNHFKEPDLRTAKAFAWLINQDTGLQQA